MGDPSGIAGSDLSHLNSPIAMYYDQPNNVIIVGDLGNRRIIQFSLDNLSSGGIVIAGTGENGCDLNQMQVPAGISLDSSRQMYVADPGCRRILRYPPNSNPSTSPVLVASVTSPQVISINRLTDDVYVASFADHRVLKFSNGSTPGIVVAGE